MIIQVIISDEDGYNYRLHRKKDQTLMYCLCTDSHHCSNKETLMKSYFYSISRHSRLIRYKTRVFVFM